MQVQSSTDHLDYEVYFVLVIKVEPLTIINNIK